MIDVREHLEPIEGQSAEARGINKMSRGLVGSQILAIAAQVRALQSVGKDILNLTVGDFKSSEFPIPEALREGVVRALQEGQTNYPPSSGMAECREAVQGLFKNRLGLSYPLESFLIASGARPMIAGAYTALIEPGDTVLYGAPSWNNNHYTHMTGAKRVVLSSTPEQNFFPTPESIKPHLSQARLLCLNTPQNPTGTVMPEAMLKEISDLIVEENARREQSGAPQLYVMFDQVYWMLTFQGIKHTTPVHLNPGMARYTIFVDGISKCFSATGLRVGWTAGPPDVIKKMAAILSHIGAWAPKPEQLATAHLLQQPELIDAHLKTMLSEVYTRLSLLSSAVTELEKDGHDVKAIAPQGAIYLSMKLNLVGKKTQDGKVLQTDEDTRSYLLEEAGVALVPFRCFGLTEDTGWFRASVGAVSKSQCEGIGARLKSALGKLSA